MFFMPVTGTVNALGPLACITALLVKAALFDAARKKFQFLTSQQHDAFSLYTCVIKLALNEVHKNKRNN